MKRDIEISIINSKCKNIESIRIALKILYDKEQVVEIYKKLEISCDTVASSDKGWWNKNRLSLVLNASQTPLHDRPIRQELIGESSLTPYAPDASIVFPGYRQRYIVLENHARAIAREQILLYDTILHNLNN